MFSNEEFSKNERKEKKKKKMTLEDTISDLVLLAQIQKSSKGKSNDDCCYLHPHCVFFRDCLSLFKCFLYVYTCFIPRGKLRLSGKKAGNEPIK